MKENFRACARAKPEHPSAVGPRPLTTLKVWMSGRGRALRVVRGEKQRCGGINHMCHAWSDEARSSRTLRCVLLEQTLHPTTHNTHD